MIRLRCFDPLLVFAAIGLLAASIAAAPSVYAQHVTGELPNIVVIMADDLGYGDVGCYGGTGVSTPEIDKLAAKGLRFTQGYCSAGTCTPTRFSLLTGVHAFRVPGSGIAPPNSPALIPAETPTIASVLNDAGYRTGIIGKWHLGLGEKPGGPDWNGTLSPGPLEIGFDDALILPTTNDRVPPVLVRNHHVENLDSNDPLWVGNQRPSPEHQDARSNPAALRMTTVGSHHGTIHNGIGRIGYFTGGKAALYRDEDLAKRWVSESKVWLSKHAGTPFFLLVTPHSLHAPRIVDEQFQGVSKMGPRGDAIAELDWTVGQIMASLKHLKLIERTLVVFCSDNGPVLIDDYKDRSDELLGDHDPNGDFRGGKYNVYEGATRTPFIVSMPGTVPVDESNQVICTIDLAASFAAWVGAKVPTGALRDSINLMPALLGETDAVGRSFLLQQDNGWGSFGYRKGKWKLVRCDSRKMLNSDLDMKTTQIPRYALYDLGNDPGETTNVLSDHQRVAERMKQELQQIIDAS
ncbi:sulfatase-like hydrolase/transferase [Aporhodopirellula aestuarii]|uniref:Sulfatase-like hydrolase/transferase n=1 Tax=Aporhodopirellula aestuarii TaxID=2950107 RepID=A0ABT0UB44_9BACT|nr:sulfatase-like hydrolase/transferase [Aporhodopirellula aestuarii]MCM2374197.1 sulfatase-like hydrolase/transferase [Aporhodopirellula aestuarii]